MSEAKLVGSGEGTGILVNDYEVYVFMFERQGNLSAITPKATEYVVILFACQS